MFHLGRVTEVKVSFGAVGGAMAAASTGLRTKGKAWLNLVTIPARKRWDPALIGLGTVAVEVPHHLVEFWEPLLSWRWPENTFSCN